MSGIVEPSVGLALIFFTMHCAYLKGKVGNACCAFTHMIGQATGQFALAVIAEMGVIEAAADMAWLVLGQIIEGFIVYWWLI
jgi:hypothetical protein